MPPTTFTYTGARQEYVVPAGCTTAKLECWGARGGPPGSTARLGGRGGYARGTINVTPGETLYVYVGGSPTGRAAGFNAGANAIGGPGGTGTQYDGGGGGGASDVRRGGDALANRVMVGGGGGGASCTYDGGGGGGTNGNAGGGGYPGHSGDGGKQDAGGGGGTGAWENGQNGSLGNGGYGGGTDAESAQGGGAGGGGYYGGGGGGGGSLSQNTGGAGGGGSGYVSGADTSMTSNTRDGHGEVIITPFLTGGYMRCGKVW